MKKGATVGVEWGMVGRPKFERLVDALLARRWRDIAKVIAPDGRGGDDGIDLEARQGGVRRIYQLKYFPDGFSGDRKTTRQRQIRKSFVRASKLEPPPVDWTLVIPAKLTPGERTFVEGLGGELEPGTPAPRIHILDTVELDLMMLDHPDIYRYVMREDLNAQVELYRLETATLTGPASLNERLKGLGELADSTDLYWGIDFARHGDSITRTLRAKDPLAHEKSPITVKFEGTFTPEHAKIREQFDRSMKFGASGSVRLPQEVVGTVRIAGPELIAGEYSNMELLLKPLSNNPNLGLPAEMRFYDEHDIQVTAHEGRITHLAAGSDGHAIRIEFYGHLNIEFLAPNNLSHTGHTEINYNLRRISPAEALGVQEILSAMNETDLVCKVYLQDQFVLSLSFQSRERTEDDQAVDDIFSVAHDLKIVQDYCRSAFSVPLEIEPLDRINLRVARLLLEGYAVAAPDAPTGYITLTGSDTPELRQMLSGDGEYVSFGVSSWTFDFGAKELTLKDLQAFHPKTRAVNGAEAITALNAGTAQGFRVELIAGDDPFFYLAMPDRMQARPRQEVALWSLPGINQPGIPTATDPAKS